MPHPVNIYLCGSVKKGTSDKRGPEFFWTEEDESVLSDCFDNAPKLLNPSRSPISRSNFDVNFGCDMFLVANSQGMIVDLRQSKGIGVGAEMMFALHVGIPIVGWTGEVSHYKRDRIYNIQGENLSNWVHPFVSGLCDFHHSNLRTASAELAHRIRQNKEKQKKLSPPHPSIGTYIEKFVERYPDFARSVRGNR